MRSRPITVVKAAPARKVENKVKPKYDTPNPFAALASLDDEHEFPPLSGVSSKVGELNISSDSEVDIAAAVNNASKRGSSLMSSSRAGAAATRGQNAGASLPLLSHFFDDSVSSTRNGDPSYDSVADLLDSFPGSESIMSIFVAGLPPVSLLASNERDRVRQELVEHLAKFAPPLRAKLIPDLSPRRVLNFAFVDFKNEEECNKAIKWGNNSLFRGAPIRLEFARGDRTIVLASPGNVDLEILKQVDESGTYSNEFYRESVRWMNLTEQLADRLCKHFGDIDKIQVGDAPIGDSIVHVTFGCRGEARLAYMAFSNLPLKAHLSAHWLNSPNITAASAQPRRALHPRGPHHPASGLRWPSWRCTSQCSDGVSAYEHNDTFDSKDDSYTSEEYVLDPIRVNLQDQENQEPGTGSPVPKSVTQPSHAALKGAPKHPKATTTTLSTEPPKLSKTALKRQKKKARKLLKVSQGESTLNESTQTPLKTGETIHASAPADTQDSAEDTAEGQLQLSPSVSECPELEALQLGDNFQGPLNYDCDNGLVPTTRPELSIQAATNVDDQVLQETQTPQDEEVEASLSRLSFTYPFCRRAPPSDARENGNAEVSHTKANGHLLQATHYSEDNVIKGDSAPSEKVPRFPLTSTPQDMGMVAAFAEPDRDTEYESENSDSSFYQPNKSPEQVPTISLESNTRANANMDGAYDGISHSVTMEHDVANLTVPLVESDTTLMHAEEAPLSLMVRSASDTAYSYSFSSPPVAASATFDQSESEARKSHDSPPVPSKAVDTATTTLNTIELPKSPNPGPKIVPAESYSEKEIVDRGCSIWVGNLSEDVTAATLQLAFSKCGTIVDIQIKNSLQRTSRFAFIMFDSRDAVERALELDGYRIEGLCIAVRRRAIKHIWVASHSQAAFSRPVPSSYLPGEPVFQPSEAMLPTSRPYWQAPEIHPHFAHHAADHNHFHPTTDPVQSPSEATLPGLNNKGTYPYRSLPGRDHELPAHIHSEVEHQYAHGYGGRGRQKGGKKNANKSNKARGPTRGGKDWKDEVPASGPGPANNESHAPAQGHVMRWPDLQERMQGYGTHMLEMGKTKMNAGHEHQTRQPAYMRQDLVHLQDPSIIRSSDPQPAHGYALSRGAPAYGYSGVASPSAGAGVNPAEGDLVASAQAHSAAAYSSAQSHYAYHSYAPGYAWQGQHYYNPYHPAYVGQVPGYHAYTGETAPSSASTSGASYHTAAPLVTPTALPEVDMSYGYQHAPTHEAIHLHPYHNAGPPAGGMQPSMQAYHSTGHAQVKSNVDDNSSFTSNTQAPQRRGRMQNGRPPQRNPRGTS
ncbi:RNA-binding protein 34 [Tilletia horrida]|uniref:RNA-binding protein 34 n=1 Tax=Tilletia horrida TaxID=155126 RepID=A0AAN6JTJ5_9BASI|nr:RNA-binding protein 34 [Tilletia horrida]KAK0555319.1 RNA-binding protein 34 [Tilletia horrida]KAK0563960.1 RNA-binding protein 34 [Tilletia horrida]